VDRRGMCGRGWDATLHTSEMGFGMRSGGSFTQVSVLGAFTKKPRLFKNYTNHKFLHTEGKNFQEVRGGVLEPFRVDRGGRSCADQRSVKRWRRKVHHLEGSRFEPAAGRSQANKKGRYVATDEGVCAKGRKVQVSRDERSRVSFAKELGHGEGASVRKPTSFTIEH